jgi:hypothetical protein
MIGAQSPAAHCDPTDAYAVRIERHLARLAQGNDPAGHLFAIERLARAARAEWWISERETQQARNGQVPP